MFYYIQNNIDGSFQLYSFIKLPEAKYITALVPITEEIYNGKIAEIIAAAAREEETNNVLPE